MFPPSVTSRVGSIIPVARAGFPLPRRSPPAVHAYSGRGRYFFASNIANENRPEVRWFHSSGFREQKSVPSASSPSAVRPTFDGSPGEGIAAPERWRRVDSYGYSNFGKMLQYQAGRGGAEEFGQKKAPPQRPVQYQRNGNPGGESQKTDARKGFDGLRQRVPRERHRWRSRPSQSHRTNRTPTLPKAASSEWILVKNVPPASELSDLCDSLNRILDYELEKGIIDLDALCDPESFTCDDRTLDALRRIGAYDDERSDDPLYSPRTIVDDGVVPLWKAPDDNSRPLNDACPMILEARVHLSYRARPVGWFLRLPNRSVVHAVLSHVRRARAERQRATHYIKGWEKKIRLKRIKWRNGLWRGVWRECERESKEGESRAMLEYEDRGEREMMCGEGAGEGEANYDPERGSLEGASETMQPIETEDQQDHVDDYLQKYLDSNPYPTSPSAAQNNQYQLLKSGSTALEVREFSPYPSDFSTDGAEIPWEQHSFHLSPLLNLSDTVVRVEAPPKTRLDDVKFMFRRHDLDAILPASEDEEDSTTAVPPPLADFPRSLGWDVDAQGNVGRLIEGTRARDGSRFARRDGGADAVVRSRMHAFLVRFATPADARMAVREKHGTPWHYESLAVVQYPRRW